MDAFALIPQLFYDLIGRIIPGASLVVCAFLIFQGPDETVKYLTTWSHQTTEEGVPLFKDLPTVLILLGNVGVSYVVGALLGGIWNKVAFIPIGEKRKHRIQRALEVLPPTLEKSDLKNKKYVDGVSFIYDYIHLVYPRVGARMAKLRAEQLMCGSISLGAVLNGLMYAIFSSKRYPGWNCLVIEAGFAVLASTGILLARHLEERCSNTMINYWLLGSAGVAEGQPVDVKKVGKG